MKRRPKEPFVPVERHETIRREIISDLKGKTFSARDISGLVRISEKDVLDHLEHIRMKKDVELEIIPSECKHCGFVFKKREKLGKPSRCPVCKGEAIEEPLFSIKA